MIFEQETDRLILRILTADAAEQTLRFYQDNAAIFEKYEPIIGDNFYSLEHQQNLLAYEYQEILKLHMIRFWLFEKGHPNQIIGTISFHNIAPNIFSSAQIGYKMDARYWRRGYCYEALSSGIRFVTHDIGIRRYEALVLPENVPSICLLEKLHFTREGLLRDKVYLQDQWRDHYLYALICNGAISA